MRDWKGHMDSDSGHQKLCPPHYGFTSVATISATNKRSTEAQRKIKINRGHYFPFNFRVTALLYSAWDLWDDHLWWPGWLSLAVVFSMVMILPLCPRPQNGQPPCVSISLLKGDCWRLYYGVKKYFLLPSLPLKLFIPAPATQQSLFIAVVFSRGMHQVWCRWFNTTLIQRQHLGCHNAAEEIKSCGLDSARCFLVIMAPL